jgi:hypothetical protein
VKHQGVDTEKARRVELGILMGESLVNTKKWQVDGSLVVVGLAKVGSRHLKIQKKNEQKGKVVCYEEEPVVRPL